MTTNLLKAFSYGIFVPLLAYTQISAELLTLCAVIIGLDIVTGSIREWLTDNFKSREFIKGMFSKFILMLVPFIMVIAGKGVGLDMSGIINLVLGTFIVAESYSTLGNIVQIRQGDKSISEQDAITMVISKAQSIIKSVLDSMMTKK